MTIYFEVTKTFLIEEVRKLIERLQNLKNRPGRDHDLDTLKETLLHTFKNETLDALCNIDDNDEKNKALFMDTISVFCAKMDRERKGKSQGSTESTLRSLVGSVSLIFDSFEHQNILSTPTNQFGRNTYIFVREIMSYMAFTIHKSAQQPSFSEKVKEKAGLTEYQKQKESIQPHIYKAIADAISYSKTQPKPTHKSNQQSKNSDPSTNQEVQYLTKLIENITLHFKAIPPGMIAQTTNYLHEFWEETCSYSAKTFFGGPLKTQPPSPSDKSLCDFLDTIRHQIKSQGGQPNDNDEFDEVESAPELKA